MNKQTAVKHSALQRSALMLACCASLFSTETLAREHLLGALDNEALLNCENLHWSGQQAEANACYLGIVRTINPPEIQAEAMWALGDLYTADELFEQAADLDPENAMILVRTGELYMRTYQYQDAYNFFNQALQIDPNNAWAHIGAAQALATGGNPEEVNMHLEAVQTHFAAPPGARLRVMLMSIHSVMERDQYADAAEQLEDAWELAEDEGLPTMQLKAYAAALAFVTRRDDEVQTYIDAALAEAPRYGDAYAIPGYFASITRRYEESGDFYQQAVDIEPQNWSAHLELGQNSLRLNRIEHGIEHIRLSYEGDGFNPKTLNLMRLLDTFSEDFIGLSFPEPGQGSGIPELVLRVDRDEADVITPYARELAESSMRTFEERYDFVARQPVTIELFPNHEDFVVRSIGMPGVGILGVTFGYLFAMDSPTGHPDETYHWGTTLWHEMAHVYTLEASEHGVPRWFSEGVSVYEEWNTGPIPGIKIPAGVLDAMAQDMFLPVAQLDDGFMRPSYENQVIVSYMQAGLIFQFIADEYGHEHIVDMLYQFVDGTDPVTAIENSLEISASDFDRHFKQYIDIQFGPMLNNLAVWREDVGATLRAYQAGDWEETVAAADRAIFTYPDYVEQDSPYIAKARAYAQLEEDELKFETLETFWQLGGYSASSLKELADSYLERDRADEAIEVFKDIHYVDPFDATTHGKLGDIYMEREEYQPALNEYLVALALEPLDMASANYRVASAYQAMNEIEQSMNYLMTALDIAPQYRPAQQLLLEMSRVNNSTDN
jgi:tetratricopeptide (TPR) repeat protein